MILPTFAKEHPILLTGTDEGVGVGNEGSCIAKRKDRNFTLGKTELYRAGI